MKGWHKESHRHYLAAKGIKTSRYNMAKSEILGQFNSKLALAERQSNKLDELDKMDDAKTFLENQTAKSLDSGDISEQDKMDIMDKASSKYDEAYDDVTDQNKYMFNKEEYEDYKKMNDKYKRDSEKESFNDTWKRLENKETDLMGLPRMKNVRPIMDFEEAEKANLSFFDWAPKEDFSSNKGYAAKKQKFYSVDDVGDVVVRKEAVSIPKMRSAANDLVEEGDEHIMAGRVDEAKLAYSVAGKLRARADEMEQGRGTRFGKWVN